MVQEYNELRHCPMSQMQMKQPQDSHDDPLQKDHAPAGLPDRVAFGLTRMLRFLADSFFARRYGHRAVVLETVAAVPGMVGGMVRHMRSLRRHSSPARPRNNAP